MRRDEPEPQVAEIAETLRELPNRWDDRRGRELDCLSSDERASIQKRRLECLSTAGRLTIKAILDFKCLRDLWLAELYDKAAWARDTERTKPYQKATIAFLGIFIRWCREHADLLPPDMPALSPLNCHVSGFKPDDVAREDFAGNCEAIASLLLEPGAGARGSDKTNKAWPDPQIHTTAKFWTTKDRTFCLSTKTQGRCDGRAEFPWWNGAPTKQMQLMKVLCFKHPTKTALAELIDQVYPESKAKVRANGAALAALLKTLRTLISDIRNKKLSPAGINPNILPSLDVEVTHNTTIGLMLAHARDMDAVDADDRNGDALA